MARDAADGDPASPAATARTARRRRGGATSREPTLSIPAPHPSAPLRERIAQAVDRACAPFAIRARVVAVGIAPLGATPVEELCGRGECVAGVLTPRAGSPGCSALFAMEPEDAFALLCVAPVDASAPLEAYVALGAAFGRAVAEALGASPPDAPCLATLEEDAAIAILLRTHAPSDTPLASVELALAVADRVEQLGEWRAHLHCLVDAKLAVPGPR